MRLRALAAAAVVILAFGGLAACAHDKPGPAPTTVTPSTPPTRPPTTPTPTKTTPPPTSTPTEPPTTPPDAG